MKAQRFTVSLKSKGDHRSTGEWTVEEIEAALRAFYPNVLGDHGTHELSVREAR